MKTESELREEIEAIESELGWRAEKDARYIAAKAELSALNRAALESPAARARSSQLATSAYDRRMAQVAAHKANKLNW